MNTDSINDIGAKRVIRSENSDEDYLFPEAYFWEDGAEKCPYGHFLTRFDIVSENGLILKDCITSDSYDMIKGDCDLDINKDLIGFPTGAHSYDDWPKPSCNLNGTLPFELKSVFPEIIEQRNEIVKE